ncbi:MAG: hypothetical protein ACE5GA_07925, partial [Candidatus Zixiibacteriota bacterium]
VPSLVGTAWSNGGGAPGTWSYIGPAPPGSFPHQWNATISSHHIGGNFMASVGYVLPQYSAPSGIVLQASAGGGGAFTAPGPPIASGVGGTTWLDYPYLEMQLDPAVPLPDLGTGHIAWVEYRDGDGDPDGDQNLIDDPGDVFSIWYSFSNTVLGPFLWPAASPPTMIQPPFPVIPGAHQTHRPAVAVTTSISAGLLPPGGVYVAWTDGIDIWLDANPGPVGGGAWGVIGPAPVKPIAPVMPPVIPAGPPILAASSIALALDEGPNCPGRLYLAWADMRLGDGDIWFSASTDGGITWSPDARVNCVQIGDQWAPQMTVDPSTGDICVVYYDQRNAPGAGVEVWSSTSSDCGVIWSDQLVSQVGPVPQVSTLATPPGPPGAVYAGDYLDVEANNLNGLGAVWNDGRNGTDEDVFFETTKQPVACVSCCQVAGNADGGINGKVNIADITFLIGRIFAGGPASPCCEEGDADGSGRINIADVTFLIARIFAGGAAPICGPANMGC